MRNTNTVIIFGGLAGAAGYALYRYRSDLMEYVNYLRQPSHTTDRKSVNEAVSELAKTTVESVMENAVKSICEANETAAAEVAETLINEVLTTAMEEANGVTEQFLHAPVSTCSTVYSEAIPPISYCSTVYSDAAPISNIDSRITEQLSMAAEDENAGSVLSRKTSHKSDGKQSEPEKEVIVHKKKKKNRYGRRPHRGSI